MIPFLSMTTSFLSFIVNDIAEMKMNMIAKSTKMKLVVKNSHKKVSIKIAPIGPWKFFRWLDLDSQILSIAVRNNIDPIVRNVPTKADNNKIGFNSVSWVFGFKILYPMKNSSEKAKKPIPINIV